MEIGRLRLARVERTAAQVTDGEAGRRWFASISRKRDSGHDSAHGLDGEHTGATANAFARLTRGAEGERVKAKERERRDWRPFSPRREAPGAAEIDKEVV
jgi:hypothetical protein